MQITRLVEQGWRPTGEVLAAARRDLRLRQSRMLLTSWLVAVLAAVGGVVWAPGADPGWPIWIGYGLGMLLGAALHHVLAGRVMTGPRVAELSPRRLPDYLGEQGRALWVCSLAAPALLAMLVAVQLLRGPVVTELMALTGTALVWLGLCATAVTIVLRASSPASSPDDLTWREWCRALTLNDLVGAASGATVLTAMAVGLGMTHHWTVRPGWEGPGIAVLVGAVLALYLARWFVTPRMVARG